MGLAHRVIPTILVKGRTMVKGERFNPWRSVGLAAQAVRIHQARGVDEVCILDVAATAEGRGPDLGLVEELSEVLFAPLAVGGGVRSVADVKTLLRAGADKVVIGSAAWNPVGDLVGDLAESVGSQAVVVAIDVRWERAFFANGTRPASPFYADEVCAYMERRGAGEILLTAIEREGTMQGYDLDLIRGVSKAVSVPVIAHGGCGSYEHMRQAIEAGASAVAAGAFFQFTDATPRAAALHLQRHGIEARI